MESIQKKHILEIPKTEKLKASKSPMVFAKFCRFDLVTCEEHRGRVLQKTNISNSQLYPYQNNHMKIKVLYLYCLGLTKEKAFLQIASRLEVQSLRSREHF